MATASEMNGGYARSPSLPTARSPDTASSVYPERAIRPLPKSRLKSKLSPEQVTTIVYPPDPLPISPTPHFSNVQESGGRSQSARLVNGDAHHPAHQPEQPLHHHCTCGEDGDSGDDEIEFDHPDYRYAAAAAPLTNGGKPLDSLQRRLLEASRGPMKPPPPGSTASSADGYESFENTSNKKKRKIPLSSASSMHQSQLSAEMASMGISQAEGGLDDTGSAVAVQQHYVSPPATTAVGTGISGAGRGRYGRQNGKHERRPLGSSTMNSINSYNARLPARPIGEAKQSDTGIENSGGIISRAIKSAAEHGPLTPRKDNKDNVSLLQSATNPSATPKTQFTFAVESESANKMADQQAAAAAAAAAVAYGSPSPAGMHLPRRAPNGAPIPSQKGMQGTPTIPPMRQAPPGSNPRAPPPPIGPAPGQSVAPAPAPKPKPRRRPSKEYALAARQRQLQQEYTNFHHRPTKDNMYICEFCEYEDIFGVPPAAMIRRYEIKDRQERKKAAEKRRLLEKAKMKNRKGKKGKGKGSNPNSVGPPPPVAGASPNGAPYDPNLPPEGEEYYEDEEYGDEYDPVEEGYENGVAGDLGYYPPSSRSGIQPPAPTPTAGAHGPLGRPPPPPAQKV